MAVCDQGNGIAASQSSADRGVNAELALQATNNQMVDLARLQQCLQVSLVERIRCGLAQARIFGASVKAAIQLPTLSSVLERPVRLFVLDEDDRDAGSSGSRCNRIDSIDNALDVVRGPLTGTKCVLNVDDEKS